MNNGLLTQAEKEIITEAVLKAVQVERERMERIQMEKRELWEIERGKDQERLEQAIQEALQEERNKSQVKYEVGTFCNCLASFVYGSFSGWLDAMSNVPQGSESGPHLVTIYVNDLDESTNIILATFDDDTRLKRR